MRSYRWQVAALIVSILLFAFALMSRLSTSGVSETPAPSPTAHVNEPSPTPPTLPTDNPTVEVSVTETPQLTQSSRSPDDVPTLREGLVGSLYRLNPLLAIPESPEADISSLIFEGLTRINTYGEPVGALALNWEIGSGGREYVFRLREDILWQDGTPFTADDVLLTMSFLSSPDFPGLPALGAFWRTIETQKIGTHLVRFRLPQPLSSFPAQLTIGILPAHAWQGAAAQDLLTHPFNLTPIGTGPYQIEALRSADGTRIDAVDLRVSPIYRARTDEPYAIDRLSFFLYPSMTSAVEALNAGELDALAAPRHADRAMIANLREFNVFTQIAPRVGMLLFNWDEGERRFFREQRVRSALLSSLNRVAPLEARLPNRVILANSPLLPNSWAYYDELIPPATNPEAARSVLTSYLGQQTASAPSDEESEDSPDDPTQFRLLVSDDAGIQALAQEIAAQWRQIGLTVEIEAVSETILLQRLENSDFETAIVELPLGADPDVYAYWHAGQYPDGLNYGAVTDDRLSEVLERARQEPSGINRVQLYRRFQIDFLSRALAIPLYYPLYTYAVRESIEGVQLGFIAVSSDRFRNIGEWRIVD